MQDSSLLEKALDLIAVKGWRSFSLQDLVDEVDGPEVVASVFETKEEILRVFSSWVSEALALTPFHFGDEEPLQERLFEVMMARFDLLSPYKRASWQIVGYFEENPLEGLTFLCLLESEMAALLGLVDAQRKYPPLFTKAMLGVYLLSLRTWHQDDTPDSEATMAYLHQALGRVCHLYSVG